MKKIEDIKEKLLEENDQKYSAEVISKWGEEKYKSSREQFKKMTEAELDNFQTLAINIIENLKTIKLNQNNEVLKKQTAELHKEWISIAWGMYDRHMHLNVVEMYVQDERFKKYYDKHGEGLAQLLRDLVNKYC